MKQSWYALASLAVAFVLTAPSLITRPLIPNNDMKITYDNPDISFSKAVFSNTNETFIVTDIKNSDYINSNSGTFLGNTNIANYFIPSEWVLSFYSSLFANSNLPFTGYQNNPYSLINYKFKQVNLNSTNVDSNNVFIFRPQDVSPFGLTNQEYQELLMNDISAIVNSKDVIDFSDTLAINNFMDTLKDEYVWNQSSLKPNELNTLRNLTGVNTTYNQLFYYIKYNYILQEKTPNLKQLFIDSYSESLYNLFEYIATTNETKYNLFGVSDVLSTSKSIAAFYGDDKVVKLAKPITDYDLDFIKYDLIRFTNTTPYYMNNVGDYMSNPELLTISHKYDATIVDQITWEHFIDQFSNKYSDVENLLVDLKVLSQLTDFSLSKNYTNIFQYSAFLEVRCTSFLVISEIVITLVCLSFPFLFWYTMKKFSKGQYNDI